MLRREVCCVRVTNLRQARATVDVLEKQEATSSDIITRDPRGAGNHGTTDG